MQRFVLTFLCLMTTAACYADSFATRFETHLLKGDWAAARSVANQAAADGDQAGYFADALVTLLQGAEQGGRTLHAHGFRRPGMVEVAIQLPALDAGPPVANPRPTRYEDLRNWAGQASLTLTAADAALAKIEGDFKLPLRLLEAGVDLDGDGTISTSEQLGRRAPFYVPDAARNASEPQPIGFDRADADWLRGYCQIMLGVCEVVLAHDFEPLFDHGGHLLFANAKTRYPFLAEGEPPVGGYLDQIVSLHALRFDVREPKRMEQARRHFLRAIELQNSMYNRIATETDDDNEWQPGPQQKGFAEGLELDEAERVAWLAELKDLQAALNGQRLMPFWRGTGKQGVNLKRVFSEPRTFDIFYWVQGPGAVPYLESGNVGDETLWRTFEGLLAGNLFSEMFAMR